MAELSAIGEWHTGQNMENEARLMERLMVCVSCSHSNYHWPLLYQREQNKLI